jgi:hypothetical protein
MNKWLIFCIGIITISCSHGSEKNKNKSLVLAANKVKNNTVQKADSLQDKENQKPLYALTYWRNDTLYLFGKFDSGLTVTLINNKDRMLFKTTTDFYQLPSDDMNSEIGLTNINSQPKTDNWKDFEYSILTDIPSDYVVLDSNKYVDISIRRVDSLIRKTTIIENLLEKSGQKESMEYSIGTSLPTVKSYDINGFPLYIISYKYFDGPNGPRIVQYQDKLFPLTGQCSYDKIYVYRLNSRYYIQSGSTCCGCGYTVFQIFEITEHLIKLIYDDDSFAD